MQFVDRQILPLDWDQRHTLNAFVNVARESDWSIGVYGYISSGLPYSPTFIERFDILTRSIGSQVRSPHGGAST